MNDGGLFAINRKEKISLFVLFGFIAVMFLSYIFLNFKTTSMLSSFDGFIRSASLAELKEAKFWRSSGFAAIVEARYKLPLSLSDEKIVMHYCNFMSSQDDWLEAKYVSESASRLYSSCDNPWSGSDIKSFSFKFCHPSNKRLSIIWNHTSSVSEAQRELTVKMYWRPDASTC